MKKIRFTQPASLRLTFHPGDEIAVAELTPELRSLLMNSRVDGQKVAVLVTAEDTASIDTRTLETAAVRTGRASGRSAAAVS